MAANVGVLDRVIRFMLAALSLYFGLVIYGGSWMGIALTAVAVILGLTGLFGFCGLYRLLGIDTRRSQPTSQG